MLVLESGDSSYIIYIQYNAISPAGAIYNSDGRSPSGAIISPNCKSGRLTGLQSLLCMHVLESGDSSYIIYKTV